MIAKTLEQETLLNIQKQYPKDQLTLPGYQDVGYKINLSTREIESPEFLSVEKDHDSEIKYFVVDRYLDHKDLSTTTCIIQYENALGDNFIYPVPFMDTYSLRHENKMILPWNISGSATAAPGEITYSFRFFEFERITENDTVKYTDNLVYNLNTLPAKSKILYGLNIKLTEGNDQDKVIKYENEAYNILLNIINNQEKIIYWNIIN